MKSHARVVVIGGGIAGCSTLYHLTREGWSDVVLLERDELTSGTTWHSAAQVTNFGAVQTFTRSWRRMLNTRSTIITAPAGSGWRERRIIWMVIAISGQWPKAWASNSRSSMLMNAGNVTR